MNFASDVLNRPLSDDVMHMQKFGYYSVDHTWKGGGSTFYGEYPTSARIPVCKLCLGIAMHERTALFVEQRECFQLPFVQPRATFPHQDTAGWKSHLSECTICAYSGEYILHKGLLVVMAG